MRKSKNFSAFSQRVNRVNPAYLRGDSNGINGPCESSLTGLTGVSTSGKSRDFGSRIRRFESSHPSLLQRNLDVHEYELIIYYDKPYSLGERGFFCLVGYGLKRNFGGQGRVKLDFDFLK